MTVLCTDCFKPDKPLEVLCMVPLTPCIICGRTDSNYAKTNIELVKCSYYSGLDLSKIIIKDN